MIVDVTELTMPDGLCSGCALYSRTENSIYADMRLVAIEIRCEHYEACKRVFETLERSMKHGT